MEPLNFQEKVMLEGGHCPPKEDEGFAYHFGYYVGTLLMWIDINVG